MRRSIHGSGDDDPVQSQSHEELPIFKAQIFGQRNTGESHGEVDDFNGLVERRHFDGEHNFGDGFEKRWRFDRGRRPFDSRRR